MPNVETNGQKEMDFMYKFWNYIENLQIYGGIDKKTKLANKFFDYCKHHGGERAANFKLIPGKFRQEFEDKLVEANIPFSVFADHRGNFAFLTRDIDGDKFLAIQDDIFKRHPEYYKERSLEDFLNSEWKEKNTTVMELRFKTEEELEMFRNKAYENGTGFIIATEKLNDEYVAYASMDSAVSDDFHSDIPSTILRMQADSTGTNKEFKRLQVKYDLDVTQEITDRIMAGEEFVIANSYDNRDSYIEVVNNELHFIEYNAESGQFNQTRTAVDIPRDLSDEQEMLAFRESLSVQLANIKNKKPMTPDQFREFQNMSPTEFRDYVIEMKTEAFENPLAPGGTRPSADMAFIETYGKNMMQERTKLLLETNTLKMQIRSEKNALSQLENQYQLSPSAELHSQIEGQKAKLSDMTTKFERLAADSSRLGKKIQLTAAFGDHKKSLDRAIESVVNKAHQELRLSQSYKTMSKDQKEQALESKILSLLSYRGTKELVAYEKFCMEHGLADEYEELVNNTKHQLDNNVNPIRIDDVRKRMKDKEAEYSRDRDDTGIDDRGDERKTS